MNIKHIAIIKDSDKILSTLSDQNLIEIYSKATSGWILSETLEFSMEGVRGIELMRAKIEELAEKLVKVDILVGRSFMGLSHQVLQKAGLTLCEMDGFETDCLEELARTIEEPGKPKEIISTPVDDGSGCFSLNLNAALAASPDLSSKKILRPFFDNTKFMELILTFDHLPPWLPDELKQRGYDFEVKQDKDKHLIIRIFPGCSQNCSKT